MRYEGNRHPVLRAARVLLFLAVIFFACGGAAESGGSLTEIRITAETGGLFDPENSTVRPAEVSFVSPSGEKLFTRTVGLALSGGTSREYEHPSLKLIADAFEEDAWLEYTGLCGQEDPSPFSHVEKYRDLKLRTGGQDASESNIRSAVMSRLCGECGFPGYLPEERAVVFLNGEFYDLCSVQPRYIRSWLARRFSLEDASRIEIIGDSELVCMEMYGLGALFRADLNLPENRERLEAQVDMEDYLRYVAIQALSNNVDWPGNNFRMWRYTGEPDPDNPFSDGKYRCLIYDTDLVWLYPGYMASVFGEDTFRAVMENDVMREGARGHESAIGAVLGVKTYRDRFVNMLEGLLHTVFSPGHLAEVMEEEAERIRETVLRYKGEEAWKQNRTVIDLIEAQAADTRNRIEKDLEEYFGLRDRYRLTVKNTEGITLLFCGRSLQGGESDTQEVFAGTDPELGAEANPGYRFAGWLVNGERREGAALVLCAEDFPDGGCVAETLSEKAEQCLVISEIRTKGKNDWIRLTNAGTGEADLGRFMISDEEEFGSASGLPGLVLKSGESVVLDGKKSTEAGAYRLLFNLSEGEALCLWDRETGECVDRVKVPRMSSVETYGLEPGGCRHVYFLNEGNVRRSR